MKIKKLLHLIMICSMCFSCTMEPRYKKPKADLPFQEKDSNKKKITEISWQDFFQSEDLQRIINLALKNNRDLKTANLNIKLAQENYDITRSNLLPTINATGYETRQKAISGFASFMPKRQFRASLSATSYEIDFFGRLRSLKKSAMENYLATKEAERVLKISLIAETVNAYAQYLLDNEILKITEENLNAQGERLKYIEARYKHGINSQLDLINANSLIETARINHETYKKLLEQDKNILMNLAGVFNDEAVPKIASLNDIKINEESLDFAPSESLLTRPDIQQAEHNLKSANANIGAARAAFFPSITLTSSYGYGSRDLASLFQGRTWVFTPQINLPIFSGGRNIAALKSANINKEIEIAQYEKAIQTAFREVLDELAERKAISQQLKSFDKILSGQTKSYSISQKKHKYGASSGLEILDYKITMLNSRQNHAIAKKEYIANLINLYKTMGGGSELE